MKKILSFSIIMITSLFIFTQNVKAIDTFDLMTSLSSGSTKETLENSQISSSVSISQNLLIYTYTYDEKSYSLTFSEEDGILSYESIIDNSEAEYIISETLISEIIYYILNDQGYSDDEYKFIADYILEENVSPYTLEANGVYFTKEYVNSEYYITSFYINLNETSLGEPSASISVTSASSESVVLNISLENATSETCIIYRGTEENSYDEIDKIDCNASTTYTDAFVSEAGTYYYKVLIEGKTELSDYVVATTSTASENLSSGVIEDEDELVEDLTEEESDNPQTGIYLPFGIICAFLIVAYSLKMFIKNKKKLFKI